MATLDHDAIGAAATLLWRHWTASTRIPELPAHCRPADRSDGYAIQAAVAALSGQRVVGWKIAATSLVGQGHIGVDGPLAGRLLSSRVATITKDRPAPAPTSLDGNAMRVAEAEFAFRLRGSLPARESVYGVQEVLDAVDAVHPAIEIPDSRYDDFARVGAPQLIADTACACWLLVGETTEVDWRRQDLRLPRRRNVPQRPAGRTGCRRQRPARPAPRADVARQRAQDLWPGPDRRRSRHDGHVHHAGRHRAGGHVPRRLRGAWFLTGGAGVASAFCPHLSLLAGPHPRSLSRGDFAPRSGRWRCCLCL